MWLLCYYGTYAIYLIDSVRSKEYVYWYAILKTGRNPAMPPATIYEQNEVEVVSKPLIPSN